MGNGSQEGSGVRNRTFRDLFHSSVRFEIPFFQRGYAWEKKQWDQLFQDLHEQVISELQSGSAPEDVDHFFGPIVVLEKLGSDQIKEFTVIDGQQRITTIYLLLGIIREALLSKRVLSEQVDLHIAKVDKYLKNDVYGNDDYLKLKVFSTKGDRLPTYHCVFGKHANPQTPYFKIDQQLYIPSVNKIDEFQNYALKKLRTQYQDIPSLVQLAEALLDCLKIVWIPLIQGRDDPQAIFESLNDKGMPLKASELLCNYIFQPISNEASGDFESLHNEHWLTSLRILESNDQFEEFLRSLFSIGESKMIGKQRKLYVHFKNKNRNIDVKTSKLYLKNISVSARLYKAITRPVLSPYHDLKIAKILIDISSTRMDSSTPFTLAVLIAVANDAMSLDQARSILHELQILLVRRKMTDKATTQYNALFPSLLQKVLHEQDPILALHDQFRKQEVWVSDQEFRESLIDRPLYRRNDISFTRMVLTEIDRSLQSFGQMPDYSTVETIEHTMPQILDTHWRKYIGSDADRKDLPEIINTVGNLCLLSRPANSSAGQNPFAEKVAEYAPITVLARQFKEFSGVWNVKAIRERSAQLADQSLKVWSWSGS